MRFATKIDVEWTAQKYLGLGFQIRKSTSLWTPSEYANFIQSKLRTSLLAVWASKTRGIGPNVKLSHPEREFGFDW